MPAIMSFDHFIHLLHPFSLPYPFCLNLSKLQRRHNRHHAFLQRLALRGYCQEQTIKTVVALLYFL